MPQVRATNADLVAVANVVFIVGAAAALGRALVLAAATTPSVIESIVAGASVLVGGALGAAAYIECVRAERAELARTRAPHARQAERNATVVSAALLVALVLAAFAVVFGIGALVRWRDALTVVGALGLMQLVWYAASTIPYAPMARVVASAPAHK
jgi:hypothetical protein